MVDAFGIEFSGDPIRGIVIVILWLTLGFSLAMLWDAALNIKKPGEVWASIAVLLWCVGVLWGYWAHQHAPANLRTPVFIGACCATIVAFAYRRRSHH